MYAADFDTEFSWCFYCDARTRHKKFLHEGGTISVCLLCQGQTAPQERQEVVGGA